MVLKIGFNQGVRVREICVAMRRFPAGFSPLRILHVSDMHLNARKKQENRLLDLLSSTPADMIVCTGDTLYTYYTPARVGLAFFQRLAERVQPRLGMHVVRGNHDNPDFARLMMEAGFNVLLNRHVVLGEGEKRWYLVGVDDPRWHYDDLRLAAAGIPTDAFKMVLAHSPDILPIASSLGVDLVLAGHTHGGQVRLPFIGALVTRSHLARRYAWGLQTYHDTLCHTTCGAGSSFPPIRLSCPQEVVLLELVRG